MSALSLCVNFMCAQWAFVYVAVYGHDFRSSGVRAYRLFRDRGWTAIVNDDLIGNALSLGGVVTGGSGDVPQRHRPVH